MARKLVVYGGMLVVSVKGQEEVIVATYTKKRAKELLNITDSDFKNFFSEIGNVEAVELALSKPETVFASKYGLTDTWREVSLQGDCKIPTSL